MHSHETTPDRKGSGISRHCTTKVSLLFLRGKANHGKSYYNLSPLYAGSRSICLSIFRVSTLDRL
jgi:hypothetical protein